MTTAEVLKAVTNDPGTEKKNPPLVYISRQGASYICGAQSTEYGNKRLLRHREYIVSTPLPYIDGEPNAMTNIFQATVAPFTDNCNPTVTAPTTISEWLASGNSTNYIQYSSSITLNKYDTVAPLYRFVGNTDTKKCLSRFGIQDPISYGTYFSDTFIRSNSTGVIGQLQGTSSAYDTGNTDHGTFTFDGATGPQFTSNDYYSSNYLFTSTTTVSYTCSNTTGLIASFIPTLGLPVCAWTASAQQSLRNIYEYNNTGMLGGYAAGAVSSRANITLWNDTTMTSYSMVSGHMGRYSYGFVSANYIGGSSKYGNLLCAIEAE